MGNGAGVPHLETPERSSLSGLFHVGLVDEVAASGALGAVRRGLVAHTPFVDPPRRRRPGTAKATTWERPSPTASGCSARVAKTRGDNPLDRMLSWIVSMPDTIRAEAPATTTTTRRYP